MSRSRGVRLAAITPHAESRQKVHHALSISSACYGKGASAELAKVYLAEITAARAQLTELSIAHREPEMTIADRREGPAVPPSCPMVSGRSFLPRALWSRGGAAGLDRHLRRRVAACQAASIRWPGTSTKCCLVS